MTKLIHAIAGGAALQAILPSWTARVVSEACGPTTRRLLSLAAVASLLSLTGCGAPHLKTVHHAERNLIGRDAAVPLACIGEPMEIAEMGTEPLTTSHRYSSAQTRGADGLLLASPKPSADANEWACIFDVTIRQGQILAIDSKNRAGWGFGSIKHCSAVVERCAGA